MLVVLELVRERDGAFVLLRAELHPQLLGHYHEWQVDD
jgi:hypothetical protein